MSADSSHKSSNADDEAHPRPSAERSDLMVNMEIQSSRQIRQRKHSNTDESKSNSSAGEKLPKNSDVRSSIESAALGSVSTGNTCNPNTQALNNLHLIKSKIDEDKEEDNLKKSKELNVAAAVDDNGDDEKQNQPTKRKSKMVLSEKYNKTWKILISLKRFSFFQLHLAYFVAMSLAGTLILFATERDIHASFIDSMFTAVSALSCSGLVVIDPAIMSSAGKVVIAFLMLFGSTVLISVVPLSIRTAVLREEVIDHQGIDPDGHLFEINYLKLRSMTRLMKVVLAYFVFFQVLGFLVLEIFIYSDSKAHKIMIDNGVHSVEAFSAFHSISAFNNAGLGLFTANLIPYVNSFGIQLILGVQILLGNTLYPIALRWILKLLKRLSRSADAKKEYSFLLLNSRECFTHLFPEVNTQILLTIVIIFNLVQWIFFLGLDWNSSLFGVLKPQQKVYSSLFQSVSTRNAGFQVFDLTASSDTMNLLQITFMYISAIPTIVTLRASALVQDDEEDLSRLREASIQPNDPKTVKGKWFLVYHWFRQRNFLLRQAIVLYSLIILSSAVEDRNFRTDLDKTVFKLIFECISAYGSVGLSLGYPGTAISFSAVLTTFSKFIIVVIFILGRHRGLPSDLDAAYTLHVRVTNRPELDDDKGGRTSVVLAAEDIQLTTVDADGHKRKYIVRKMSSAL